MGNDDRVTFDCAVCKQNIRVHIPNIELIINENKNITASYICPNSTCPSAGATISTAIGEKSIKVLKEKGVHVTDNRKEEPPPITYDDLLDFHEQLKDAEIQNEPWFKKLVPIIQKIIARRNEKP